MKLSSFPTLTGALLCATLYFSASPAPAPAADLSPQQVEAIRAQLEAMRDTLEGKASERNRSAWSVFMSASQDNKAAAELYENCTRIVDFEREGRTDSEFRDWQSGQRDRYKNDGYMESMRLQLRWLAITCKAAEAEKFETVLPDVLGYLDSLTQLTEMPGNAALNPVTGSIFVKAYQLERVVARDTKWEPVPYNIEGIYEKIILPYLRDEKPSQLMTAWDKRISQQTHLVEFIKARQDDELKGDRDEKRRIMERQRREGSRGVLGNHDEDDFINDTLPRLKWARLIDKYMFVDKVSAAQEILVFLNENITNKRAIDWLNQFAGMVADTESPGRLTQPEPDPDPSPTTTSGTTPPTGGTTPPTTPSGPLKFD
jgi:hypothetical protein